MFGSGLGPPGVWVGQVRDYKGHPLVREGGIRFWAPSVRVYDSRCLFRSSSSRPDIIIDIKNRSQESGTYKFFKGESRE